MAAGTLTGRYCNIWLAAHAAGTPVSDYTSKDHATFAISDFSLTMDRGTVEQELLGQIGNFFTQGALSIDGSLSQCRFGASGNSDLLNNMVDGTGNYAYVAISGQVGDNADDLKWYLTSCQITGYDITLGDADTITEASIDFVVLDPFNVTYDAASYCISDA